MGACIPGRHCVILIAIGCDSCLRRSTWARGADADTNGANIDDAHIGKEGSIAVSREPCVPGHKLGQRDIVVRADDVASHI